MYKRQVLDPLAHADFLQHFHIVVGALLDALGLQQFAFLGEFLHLLLHLDGNQMCIRDRVYILLRASVILVMLAQIFNRNFENVFLCVLTLFLFMVPSMLERKLDIALPNTLEIIILLFIYAAEIMGEIGAYYVTFPYWDTVLHTLNGFLCAAIGFSLLDILNRHNSARFHPVSYTHLDVYKRQVCNLAL